MATSNEISEKLKKIECPFTWSLKEIDKVIKGIKGSKRVHDDEEFVPILKWMRLLMGAYEKVAKDDLPEAQKCIKTAQEMWDSVKDEHGKHVSLNILENIYKGSKCYVEMKAGNFEDVEKTLATINVIDYEKSAIERSTLNGCKCVTFSVYKDIGELGYTTAITFAKRAIKDNPDFATWHFMLGKSLRRLRRFVQLPAKPSFEEENSFKKAYELSSKPIYGIYFAQVYKEKYETQKALEIYKKIYQMKPESCSVRLRIALGFIRQNKLNLAKECLDYVEEKNPNDCMFLHYKGLYFEAKKDYEKASEYFLKATGDTNFGADISFLKCKAKLMDGFNFVEYLQKMLKTYASFDGRVLDILLNLAACYNFIENDLLNASKCYLQAFEKYANSKLYQSHGCILGGKANIYNFLQKEFLPKAFKDSNPATKKICRKLKEHCDKKYHSEKKYVQRSINKLKVF